MSKEHANAAVDAGELQLTERQITVLGEPALLLG